MKILIQNYSSILSTEAIYLDSCFNNTQRLIESNIWDTNTISTFDAIDRTSPNIIICHYNAPVLNDIFKYLSNNKNIELALNITGIQQKHLDILENLMEINSVNCPLMITNIHKSIYEVKSAKKRKILNLLPAVDLFVPMLSDIPEYSLEAAILSDSKEIASKNLNFKTYHKIGIGTNDDFFDFTVRTSNMASLYKRYKKIVIASTLPTTFSQFFFDAVYHGNKVVLKTDNDKKMGEILGEFFEPVEEDEDMASIVKTQIKTKHTCYNRAARLMKELKNEQAAKVLQNILVK